MHWKNSSFQVVAFIAGKCHTADEARRKLLLLREERRQAIDHAHANGLRAKANEIRAERALNSSDEADRLDATATLHEIRRSADHAKELMAEAQREVEFLDLVIGKLEPFLKYKNLPDHEAFQAIQREEWCLELIQRAQNFLYCNGTIPHDHFSAMRAHPDFSSVIRPVVGAMQEALFAKDVNKLASYTIVPGFLQALSDSELLGPATDVKAILSKIRLELPGKT